MKDFITGEKVCFQILEDDEPRWNIDEDRGQVARGLSRPVFGVGEVVNAAGELIKVVHQKYTGEFIGWIWPQPSNASHLYKNPGYLQRIETEISKPVQPESTCVCTMTALWQGGCPSCKGGKCKSKK